MNDKVRYHPFGNDPFADVWGAFRQLWPEADCYAMWDGDLRDEDGRKVYGMTIFEEGEKPMVMVDACLQVWDAIEVLAHELAHVAVGEGKGHGPAWVNAFNALHARYEEILRDEGGEVQYKGGGGADARE